MQSLYPTFVFILNSVRYRTVVVQNHNSIWMPKLSMMNKYPCINLDYVLEKVKEIANEPSTVYVRYYVS